MRTCPFTGCDQKIAANIFACNPHLLLYLTAIQRVKIKQAYDAWSAGAYSLDDLRAIQQRILDETKIGGKACG